MPGPWPSRAAQMINDLEAPIARHHPEIDQMKTALRRAGALAAAMSGSGSTVFGLFQRRIGRAVRPWIGCRRSAGACCSPSRSAAANTPAAAGHPDARQQPAARHEEVMTPVAGSRHVSGTVRRGHVSASRLPHSILLALLAVALLGYLVDLGGSSIWDANEAYYVETPREMLESGDYINPSFNYEPRFNKPVLSLLDRRGLYHVFGVSVDIERLAIAAAALITIGASFLLARAASGTPLAPLLAAAGTRSGPALLHVRRRILIDVALAAIMTLTLLFFVLAERYPKRRRALLIAMYVAVGLRRAGEGSRRRGAAGARVLRLSLSPSANCGGSAR